MKKTFKLDACNFLGIMYINNITLELFNFLFMLSMCLVLSDHFDGNFLVNELTKKIGAYWSCG